VRSFEIVPTGCYGRLLLLMPVGPSPYLIEYSKQQAEPVRLRRIQSPSLYDTFLCQYVITGVEKIYRIIWSSVKTS